MHPFVAVDGGGAKSLVSFAAAFVVLPCLLHRRSREERRVRSVWGGGSGAAPFRSRPRLSPRGGTLPSKTTTIVAASGIKTKPQDLCVLPGVLVLCRKFRRRCCYSVPRNHCRCRLFLLCWIDRL